MARPKKLKSTRALKPRKPKFKKVKNSFLEIGKSYNFYIKDLDSLNILKDDPSCSASKLLGVNDKEYLIQHPSRGEVILKKEIVDVISEDKEEITLK